MTHSHDTATPALSVESEYVLVPREPTLRMVEIGDSVVDWCKTYTMDGETDPARVWRAMWDAAAPAPNPSPAAKGGEAEALEPFVYLREHDMRELAMSASRSRDGIRIYRVPEIDGEKLHPLYGAPAMVAALATPSPQPANAVREALEAAYLAGAIAVHEEIKRDHPDAVPRGDPEFSEAARDYAVSRAALAADPAPAGEAVEAPPACDWPGCIGEGRPCACDERADERLARLREDLERVTRERVTRERDTFADICLVVSGHLELPHSESGPCDDSRRYDRELTSLEALYRRTEDERVEHMGKRFKAEAEAETFKRERDDARKALETVREDLGLFRDFVINNATVWVAGSGHHHPMWARIAAHLEGYESPRAGEKWPLVRPADTVAARSASREGASDE